MNFQETMDLEDAELFAKEIRLAGGVVKSSTRGVYCRLGKDYAVYKRTPKRLKKLAPPWPQKLTNAQLTTILGDLQQIVPEIAYVRQTGTGFRSVGAKSHSNLVTVQVGSGAADHVGYDRRGLDLREWSLGWDCLELE